jgi:hypothetical protein
MDGRRNPLALLLPTILTLTLAPTLRPALRQVTRGGSVELASPQ